MLMQKLPELLCPAGDFDALRAAVDSGADAVYLGYKAFGARASAVNFDAEALSEAVRYAHLYHTRIHVTVNTLVKEREFPAVRQALTDIAASGADAVIVQDLGVAALVRDEFPTLALHASTQMGLSNASDASFAKQFGFSRVVLARECSLEDIRKVVQTGIETEVFAHGALCSGVSGRCLMSSMAGGRSGNRGRCAQSCRLRIKMGEREGALLSLRDLCTLQHLDAFCREGVRSLKIEGRLKSPEYVAVVTSVYRKALDAIQNGAFDPEDPQAMDALLQIFNRGGFTRGHAFGAQDSDLCASQRVSHEGVPLGTIIGVKGRFATLRVARRLNDGDSLQIRGRQDMDMRYSGHGVNAGDVATLRLRPGLSPSVGSQVSRLSDASQLEAARAHCPPMIPITMQAAFFHGQPMRLTLSDGVTTVSVEGDTVQNAQKRAAAHEDVFRQLSKLGETPFFLKGEDDLYISIEDQLFLPVSALNDLRRNGVQALTEARILAFSCAERPQPKAQFTTLSCDSHSTKTVSAADTLAVVFSDPKIAGELLNAGAGKLIFEPLDLRPDALSHALSILPDGCLVQLPPQMSQMALENALQRIQEHKHRLAGIVAGCVGQIPLVQGLPVWAGPGVPVSNRRSMEVIQSMPVDGMMLWPEWSAEEQKELTPFVKPAYLKVYGREVLMLLNHCPERVARGLKDHRDLCALCTGVDMVCGAHAPVVQDQKGYRFPLQRTVFPEGCVLRVLGALPTDLRMYDRERRDLGAGMLLHFTTESHSEQIALTQTFASVLRGRTPTKPENATSGHWRRGIE